MKLVVVGGAPYASDYINRVRRAADPRVVFPGYVFGPGYWELQRNAYLFCAPTEVGGTHPVILESLVAGNCVLVNDYRPNAETVGDAGVYFSGAEGVPDLARQLERLLAEPELVDGYREQGARAGRAVLVGRRGGRLRAAAARGVRVERPRAAADGAPRRARARHRAGRRVAAGGLELAVQLGEQLAQLSHLPPADARGPFLLELRDELPRDRIDLLAARRRANELGAPVTRIGNPLDVAVALQVGDQLGHRLLGDLGPLGSTLTRVPASSRNWKTLPCGGRTSGCPRSANRWCSSAEPTRNGSRSRMPRFSGRSREEVSGRRLDIGVLPIVFDRLDLRLPAQP